jgi:hypothetical protein
MLVAFLRRQSRMLAAGSIGLLWLSSAAILLVAVADPALLKELVLEANQAQAAAYFVRRFLPPDLAFEPNNWPQLPVDSLLGRLEVAAYFLGFGWYLAASIGAVGLYYSMAQLRRADEQRIALMIAAAGIAVLTGVCAAPYFASELAISAAAQQESAGHPGQAIGLYRRAIARCGWYRVNLDLYERIGAIDSTVGRTQTSEYRIYHAELLAARDDLPAAIYEFESLAGADPPRAALLRMRAAELRTSYGADLYMTASFGAAVDTWQRALEDAPNMWLAAFYLTRGEFAVGRYRDSVEIGRRLATQLADPVLLANLYGNLGDCYTRLGALADARAAYRRSWQFANKLNWRSLSALAGS